jgi:hypothetical protein
VKYVVAGVLAVLAAAGATLLASRRVEALADLTRPVLSGTTLAAVAFAVAGLAVVGGVALLTAPSRRAASAARRLASDATGPTPVVGTAGPSPAAEPDPLTEPLTIPAPRTSVPVGAALVPSEPPAPSAPTDVVPDSWSSWVTLTPTGDDAPDWAGSTTPSRHAAAGRVPSWSTGRG